MYRYYGGTRERTIEQGMADIKWLREHGDKNALTKSARGDKVRGAVYLALLGLFAFVLVALVVWGICAVVSSGFSWQLVLFNPVTFIFFAAGGLIIAASK